MNLPKLKNKFVLGNELPLIISSVLIAIVLWFIISITQYEIMTKNINDVPISMELSEASESSGLSLISCDTQKVNVKIEGNRTEIGGIENEKNGERGADSFS